VPYSITLGIQRLTKIMRRLAHKRFGVLPLRYSLKFLSEWFATPLGQVLLEQEQALIDEQIRNLFGYHLLQLSVAKQVDLLQASRISHRFALYPQVTKNACVSAVADFNHLPLPANSIDVVLLHHVLDYSQSPHQVLRETAGVLMSRGHLIVVGFNPWSLFGFGRWCARLLSRSPQWRHQSLRLGRVLDWLEVLDFEPVHVQQGFYRPPFQQAKAIKYLQWLEHWGKKLRLPWGGFYIIVARKDHLMLTPIKPEWQGYAGLRGWGVTKILGRANRSAR
jgi:SAM-dependent methyltransferase